MCLSVSLSILLVPSPPWHHNLIKSMFFEPIWIVLPTLHCRKPHELSPEEVQLSTGVDLKTFWKLVDVLKAGGLTSKKISCEAQTLLYLTKLRMNDSNKRLGHQFNVSRTAAANIFKNVAMIHFSAESKSNEKPRSWSRSMSEEAKNAFYEDMANTNNVFYDRLVSKFQDPLNENRKPVVLNLDS